MAGIVLIVEDERTIRDLVRRCLAHLRDGSRDHLRAFTARLGS